MPTYEYLCDNCEHTFEQFQSITARPMRKCPACGKMKLQRLIGSGAGIIFKGKGFYQTDYPTESYKAGQKAEKPKSETTDKKQTKDKPKTESKPKETTKKTSTKKQPQRED